MTLKADRQSNTTENCFFRKTDKMGKPLAKLNKGWGKRRQKLTPARVKEGHLYGHGRY